MPYRKWILLFLSFPIIIWGQTNYTVHYSRSDLTLIKREGFDYIKMKSSLYMGEVGKPHLPTKNIQLLIPPQMDVGSVTITDMNSEDIPGYYYIYPTQFPKLQNGALVQPDSNIYSLDLPYPNNIIKVVGADYFDGSTRIVQLQICPFIYKPKSGKLTLLTQISFNLNLKASPNNPPHVKHRTLAAQEIYNKALNNLIDDKTAISLYQQLPDSIYIDHPKPISSKSLNKTSETGLPLFPVPGTLTIITNESLAPAFTDFINQKAADGITARIATVEAIYAYFPQGDTISNRVDPPGCIRQYLIYAYSQGCTWVLLGGDATIVPPRYLGNIGLPKDLTPTDLYYSNLTNAWNVFDWMVPSVTPNVFVGRIPFNNQQDILQWTSKVIQYETNPFPGNPTALNHVMWSSADQLEDLPDELLQSFPSWYTHTVIKETPSGASQNPTGPSGADVINELNNGYGFYNIYCHGGGGNPGDFFVVSSGGYNSAPYRSGVSSYDSYSDYPSFNNETGNGIDNTTNYCTIAFSISCDNGAFDLPGNDCIAKAWLRVVDGGGPAFLGNTRDGYSTESQLEQQFLFYLFPNGETLGLGALEAYAKYDLGMVYDYIGANHHLFGDPSMNVKIYQQIDNDIMSSTTWSGNIEIDNPIAVLNGATLTIAPGTNVFFNHNAHLNVYSTLIADAEEQAAITFQPAGATGDTNNYVRFATSSSSNSVLKNVILTNIDGIKCDWEASIIIEDCSLINSFHGIYVYHSSPQINNNYIYNPIRNGIWCQSTAFSNGYWLGISGNTIVKTSSNINYHNYQGIWIENCDSPVINENEVEGFWWGNYNGNSTVFFASDPYEKNNLFADNLDGVGSGWGTSLFAGNEGDDFGVNNSFRDNTNYNIYCYEESWAEAGYNYWGGGHKAYSDGSEIDFYSDLSTDPWPETNSANIKPSIKPSSVGHINKSLSDNNLDNNLSKGLLLEKQGRIDDAINFYKDLISNDKNVRIALLQLVHIKNKYAKSEIVDYFGNLLTSNPKHFPKVKKILADIYLTNNQFDNAMTAYDNVIQNDPTGYDGITARFEKLFAHLNIKNNPVTASQILSEIKGLKSEDMEVQMLINGAEDLINSNSKEMKKSSNLADVNIPKTYKLYQNYPNPFNPSTTIRYQIPKPGLVSIKVYDILGREVTTLVNENKIAGTYDFNFNASRFASGVYIYQLRVNDFVSSQKMIIIK
ncbi:MAG: C25 family cysteine peptidase [Ignavibacteriaceae bacterium]|nr:C25 family cysteine peptidase [Ignavibacteriaceae bacterium]